MINLKRALTCKISRDHAESFFKAHATTGKTLDVGGGNTPYREHFPNTVCLDIVKRPTVDIVGDAHDLPFPDESFDTVLCTGVLNALHTPQQAINEMNRVLKPGGTLVLSTDSIIFPLHGVPHDYFRPTQYGLTLLLERAGFSEITCTAEKTQYSLAIFLQRIAMQCTFRGGRFVRGLVYLLAHIVATMPNLIKEEYGNAYRTVEQNDICPAMLYAVATRK